MKQQLFVRKSNSISEIVTKKSIAILSIGIAMLLFSCKNDMKEVKEFAELKKQPSLIAEDFETIHSDSARIDYKLTTKKLIYHEEEDPPFFEYPQGVHIEKFDRDMNITASIKADYAKMFAKNTQWEAKNNVIAVNAKGDTLKTEQLFWDEKKGKIYSDEYVEILSEGDTITGIGLEASQDFSSWRIDQPTAILLMDMEETEK